MKVKSFEQYLNESESEILPIKRSDLIKKIASLEGKHNVNKYDIQSLAFVGTKAQMTKVESELKKMGVKQYFDPMLKDDTQRGTWIIDAMYATDHGLIIK
jgi:hypothetical protein